MKGKKKKRNKRRRNKRKDRNKSQKKRTIEIKKIVKKWNIWSKEEEVAKLEKETKRLVLEHFYK